MDLGSCLHTTWLMLKLKEKRDWKLEFFEDGPWWDQGA